MAAPSLSVSESCAEWVSWLMPIHNYSGKGKLGKIVSYSLAKLTPYKSITQGIYLCTCGW